MVLIGYARVSTEDQSLDLQLDALRQAGCERVFTDKASAARTQRPGLSEARSHLREGDVLVVWKLDRLGRSVKGLIDLVSELAKEGSVLKVEMTILDRQSKGISIDE
jgi:DNA invertase Pin-like site-specific DNA recombinase